MANLVGEIGTRPIVGRVGYRGSGVGLRTVDEGPDKPRRCYRCGREGDSLPGVKSWGEARKDAEEGERDRNSLPCSPQLS